LTSVQPDDIMHVILQSTHTSCTGNYYCCPFIGQ
jgi:hypothetical protein